MKKLAVIVFVLLSSVCAQAQYKITWKKVAIWSLEGVAGATWGAREAYHADPTVFERHWGVNKYSFFGSHAWERNYKTNRYLSPEGIPNEHKSEIFANFGRDFWHTSGYTAGALVVTCSFTLGASKQETKHKVLDQLIGAGCFIIPAKLVFDALRK